MEAVLHQCEAEAEAEDVESNDAIINATYDVISGDIGQKRNWARLRSLLYPGARLISAANNNHAGIYGAVVLDAEEFIALKGNFIVNNGYRETEIARRTEAYANIAHVFSTCEGKFKHGTETITVRGINSFQLINDGKRWWLITVFWQFETPDNPVPEKYLN